MNGSIDIRELKSLLEQGETSTVEFKESFQEEALQTVGAFANTQGGILLVGVRDSGTPKGVTIGKATLRDIADRIASCTEPRVVPNVSAVSIQGRDIIVIQVPEYPIKPIAVRGRCFRRVGDANRQLSPSAIAELHLASTGTSWDARLLADKTLRDLDLTKVRRYMMLATNVGRRKFVKGNRPQEVLEKLELIKDGHPTWAAVLLFGKDPQSPLIQSTVHCGRFRTAIDIVDNRMIEGSIIDQIDETMDFLKKHINVQFVITGKPRRDEIWDYPLEALREAVVNAICHRDYGDTADIQIKVFDDSIRIWSPGKLLFGVSIEDLYNRSHASKPRNKLIAQVFYDLEIIERYGSGIHRMLDACVAAELPEPTIEEATSGVVITFRKAPGREQVTSEGIRAVAGEASAQSESGAESGVESGVESGAESGAESLSGKVIRLLAEGPKLKSEIARGLGKNSVTGQVNRLVARLLSSGIAERTIPDKPTSRLQKYRLTAKGRRMVNDE